MAWSESELHAWILELRGRRAEGRPLVGAPGSDTAVLARHGEREAICVDQVIEGVHFRAGTSGRLVGRKAAARALSDLAAGAARPRALLLALRAPGEASARFLKAVIEGVWERAREHGALLVGGDLACAPGPLGLSVTAIGTLGVKRPPPGRERVRPGDRILLSGAVGGSPLGRHLTFEPRLALGRWLHARGARALMDVSDGLALDLSRLAARSAVRIELEVVPIHPDARRLARRTGRAPREHALSDGEDHELLAAVPARTVDGLLAAARRRFPALVAIGRARRGSGLWIAAEDGPLAPWRGNGGWVHGS